MDKARRRSPTIYRVSFKVEITSTLRKLQVLSAAAVCYTDLMQEGEGFSASWPHARAYYYDRTSGPRTSQARKMMVSARALRRRHTQENRLVSEGTVDGRKHDSASRTSVENGYPPPRMCCLYHPKPSVHRHAQNNENRHHESDAGTIGTTDEVGRALILVKLSRRICHTLTTSGAPF